jgi:TetR/AcrR family transcriptional regulator, regulator of biofilm formation and stress response
MAKAMGNNSIAETTKSRILQSTIDLVLESGINGVSHRKIAERAGIPLGSTTYHFESLVEILRSAVGLEFERDSVRRRFVVESFKLGQNPTIALIELMVPASQADSSQLSAVYQRLGEIQFHPGLRDLLKAHQRETELDISTVLKLAGLERVDASLVMALLEGYLIQWMLYDESLPWLIARVDFGLRQLG